MFWRFKGKDGKDSFGRTFEEVWQEHALWCLDVFRKNEPDNEEKMNYIFKNSPTHQTRPAAFMKCMSGDAVFNAYLEIKMHLKSFKKYYTQEDIKWIKNCLFVKTGL